MSNDQIFETVITTQSADGTPHVPPMGVRYRDETVILMPFKPSTTLDNIDATGHAVLNIVTDTRVFAGAVTGRRHWMLVPADKIAGVRLTAAISHAELKVIDRIDDAQRPVLKLTRVHEELHQLFGGFNRAQAAVIEAAVLVSRLGMLPRDKLEREMAYLQIAIDKTAGPGEHEAWGWLREAVDRHLASEDGATGAAGA